MTNPVPTYVDANVLIVAAKGQPADSERAFAVLADPNRRFARSIFLDLEILPNSHGGQLAFYEEFLKAAEVEASDYGRICALAKQEAIAHGISAMDALHLAAASTVQAEFVTFERLTRPLHRSTVAQIVTLAP